jgi:hypothetical protein
MVTLVEVGIIAEVFMVDLLVCALLHLCRKRRGSSPRLRVVGLVKEERGHLREAKVVVAPSAANESRVRASLMRLVVVAGGSVRGCPVNFSAASRLLLKTSSTI